MNYEYWFDVIEFFNEINDRFINLSFRLMKHMHEKGVIMQIGDISINEIFKKADLFIEEILIGNYFNLI